MEISVFNQGMVFEEVNMRTKIISPLEEPNREICRFHGVMKIKEPRMAMICVL